MRKMLTWDEARELISSETVGICSEELTAAPLVSVSLVTYQNREFIEQAMESIMAQETDFPFEVVAGDDGSDDGTFDVLGVYHERYPEKVRLFRSKRNLGRHTGNSRLNLIRNLQACRGKYIALLEGDDYWTFAGKLQAQVEFMERGGYDLVFHNVEQHWEIEGRRKDLNPAPLPNPVSLAAMAGGYIAQPGSYLFRNDLDWFRDTWFVNLDAADNAIRFYFSCAPRRAGYIHESWSVWRRRPGTLTDRVTRDGRRHLLERIGILVRLEDRLGCDCSAEKLLLLDRAARLALLQSEQCLRPRYWGRLLVRQARNLARRIGGAR